MHGSQILFYHQKELDKINGYTVLEAQDGREALQVSEEHAGPIHLSLTDLVMPGMSGRAPRARCWGAGKRVFGRALRKEEREYLELMFNRVRFYIQACTYQFPAHAMDGINVAIGLDHEIRLRKIEEV